MNLQNLPREAKVLLGQGEKLEAVCSKLAITSQTYYRWRKSYGGMRTEQAKRLKELERENGRLKRLVVDLSLDNAMRKEALRGSTPELCVSLYGVSKRSRVGQSVTLLLPPVCAD